MGWLGDGSHREQGRQAWTAVGLPPRYTPRNIPMTSLITLFYINSLFVITALHRCRAGMRLELESRMNSVVRHISSLMSNSSFQPFKYASKHNTRVLSGEEEGVFAWIAVNYLRGVFNVDRSNNSHTGNNKRLTAWLSNSDNDSITCRCCLKWQNMPDAVISRTLQIADVWGSGFLDPIRPTWPDDVLKRRIVG